MWFIYAILTLIFWGFADLFYKIGNNGKDKYSHIKTSILVGLVMGIHATIYLLVNKVDINIMEVIKYLPVSFCYIFSMVIGYKGLKYIELSICSPIENSSGIITSLLLVLIFKISLSNLEIVGILLIFIGVILLSLIEIKQDKLNKHDIFKFLKIQAIFFPIIYSLFDGLGTFLDSIYLDQLSIIGEDSALVAYEYTFLLYGIVMYIYLRKFKNEKISIKQEKPKLFASILETLGQFTYVFALANNSVITIPIIGCYSILSILLSRIFLKEKLTLFQYISIFILMLGILILGIFGE